MYKKKLLILLFFLTIFFFGKPDTVKAAASFSQAYTTLTNSRLSFKASVNSAGVGNSANTATIQTGQTANDTTDSDTGNLFPGDIVCFNGMAGNGCKNSQPVGSTYVVQDAPTTTIFTFSPALAGTLVGSDRVIATQSGQMVITFKPTTNLAALDKLILTIPAVSSVGVGNSSPADGIPDSSGFDKAALPSDLLAGTGCTGNACLSSVGVGLSAAALSTGATTHTITITLNAAINNTTSYTLTLGNSTNATLRFLNPAPSVNTHTRGVADTYSIRLYSQNTAQTITYDDTTMKIAPIDGVLVSANVELSLSYTIGSIATATTVPSCGGAGFTTTSATTATAVPFGSIVSMDAFYKAAQTHTIATNTTNGYVLTVNYDMPLNLGIGSTTPGVTIPDTTCQSTPCTTTTAQTWTDAAAYNGFGYTLGNIAGSDAAFTYATGFKPFSSSAITIMSKASKTSSSQVATCYQLSVDSTQDTGYYKDKLTYVATPKF